MIETTKSIQNLSLGILSEEIILEGLGFNGKIVLGWILEVAWKGIEGIHQAQD
jgi:hypothetical protein